MSEERVLLFAVCVKQTQTQQKAYVRRSVHLAHAQDRRSHAGTVVPECFKDDNASQWKSGKFDPRSRRNPCTDRHQNLHG